jgi:hypothetical protein
MQTGLTDPDSHFSMSRGGQPNRPPELIESSLRVDVRSHAHWSWPRDPGPSSFRFHGIDRNCRFMNINQGRVARNRHRKWIVQREPVSTQPGKCKLANLPQ